MLVDFNKDWEAKSTTISIIRLAPKHYPSNFSRSLSTHMEYDVMVLPRF